LKNVVAVLVASLLVLGFYQLLKSQTQTPRPEPAAHQTHQTHPTHQTTQVNHNQHQPCTYHPASAWDAETENSDLGVTGVDPKTFDAARQKVTNRIAEDPNASVTKYDVAVWNNYIRTIVRGMVNRYYHPANFQQAMQIKADFEKWYQSEILPGDVAPIWANVEFETGEAALRNWIASHYSCN
jgi:hypothetical protein